MQGGCKAGARRVAWRLWWVHGGLGAGTIGCRGNPPRISPALFIQPRPIMRLDNVVYYQSLAFLKCCHSPFVSPTPHRQRHSFLDDTARSCVDWPFPSQLSTHRDESHRACRFASPRPASLIAVERHQGSLYCLRHQLGQAAQQHSKHPHRTTLLPFCESTHSSTV